MTSTARVLVVTSGLSTHQGLAPLLSSSGYQVIQARTGEQALDIVDVSAPNAVILDVGIADIEASEICRRIRRRLSSPIILLTTRRHEADKIAALEAGADDYLTIPFSTDELLYRVRVALRPIPQSRGDTGRLHVARLTIDLHTRRVLRDGGDIGISGRAFDLLAFFARHTNRVLTFQTILSANRELLTNEAVWEGIADLRLRIEPDPARPRYLVSEPWVGFRLVDGVR